MNGGRRSVHGQSDGILELEEGVSCTNSCTSDSGGCESCNVNQFEVNVAGSAASLIAFYAGA